eukprot:GHRQ01011111.1.p1 GENE.GHRQ01011111.1~~GHRQ01011111.1.p1  ORF type:complete len:136 (-),score=17.45 GHRQ01011111.1:281-688(-)
MTVSPASHSGNSAASKLSRITCCTAPLTVPLSNSPLPRPRSPAAAGSATSVSAKKLTSDTAPVSPDTVSCMVMVPVTCGSACSCSNIGSSAALRCCSASDSGRGPSKNGEGSVNQPCSTRRPFCGSLVPATGLTP